jgi:uncharacterized Zn finger protein
MARQFGSTWWGSAWVDALEHGGSGYESRLPRGRTYARRGAVRELELAPGHLAARVVGRSGELYQVDIGVRQLAPAEWEQVADAISSRAAHLAALLDGELHPGVVADAAEVDVQLLPRPSDLRPDCSCPDWAEPCKHAAAACYVAADELDRDPFGLFLLRGMGRDELVELVRARRSVAPGSPEAGAAQPEAADAAGVDASTLWHGRTLQDPLPDVPATARAATPRRPGRHVPWEADLPRRSGVDPARVDELAEDAVERAWSMLVDEAPSGLTSPPLADLARRARIRPELLGELASRAGVAPLRLRAWGEAWQLGGDVAVTVLADAGSWSTDQELLAQGRERLVELGVPRRSIALNYDSLSMAGSTWLVLGPDDRWYRLQGQGKHDTLRLVAPPGVEVVDLVEDLVARA